MNHPPHIYLDNTWYIITGGIFERRPLLKPAGHKELVRDCIRALADEFDMELAAWVLLDNHYHLLIKSSVGTNLRHFFRRLHGRTSFDLNGRDGVRGRQVWHNYWDTCIRTDSDYWTRFNYIHHNPVKHGYVQRHEDWPDSSFHLYLEQKGEEWLLDSFRRYPVVDFTEAHDTY